jgi:hypothetical protein
MFRNLVGYIGSGRVSWNSGAGRTFASKASMWLEDARFEIDCFGALDTGIDGRLVVPKLRIRSMA